MRLVALLSGGLDSTVNLALACQRAACGELSRAEVALALTCDYGQKSAAQELRAARAICDSLAVAHELLEMQWLGEISSAALTSGGAVPQVGIEMLDDAQTTAASAKAVWVPNRNGLLINAAACFAEALGCEGVLVGFNREEAQTFPDNSAQFVEAVNRSLALSTLSGVRVVCYTQDMDKAEIAHLGREIGAPLYLCWACYLGGDGHCWQCESCSRFKRALTQSGNWEWYQEKCPR